MRALRKSREIIKNLLEYLQEQKKNSLQHLREKNENTLRHLTRNTFTMESWKKNFLKQSSNTHQNILKHFFKAGVTPDCTDDLDEVETLEGNFDCNFKNSTYQVLNFLTKSTFSQIFQLIIYLRGFI